MCLNYFCTQLRVEYKKKDCYDIYYNLNDLLCLIRILS